jgi:ArsR family transcriptional regulator, virulence genes transcriptional regulator
MNISIYEAADKATALLKALANRNRLLLLCQLVEGERSVGEMAARLQLRESAVSQQLMLLRKDRLVAPRRDGQMIYYRLASPAAAKVIETLYEIFCAEAGAAPDVTEGAG